MTVLIRTPPPRVVTLRDGARWTRYSLAWAPGEALVEEDMGSCYTIHLMVAEQQIEFHAADIAWSETIDQAMTVLC